MFLTVLRAVFWLRPFLVLFSMKSIKKKRSTLNEALSWYHVSAGSCETPTLPVSVTRACGSHAALGTSRQAQPCAASEQVGLQPPHPWRRMRPVPPQAALRGGGCTCVWAWGRLCVSSAPEAGSGSPDAVTLKLDAVRLERDVGRLGTDAGKLGTAELGLSPSYGPGRRLQNLWSHISPSNSGSSLNALPFLYTEVVQIDSFEHLSRTCICKQSKQGVFPVDRDRGPVSGAEGLS